MSTLFQLLENIVSEMTVGDVVGDSPPTDSADFYAQGDARIPSLVGIGKKKPRKNKSKKKKKKKKNTIKYKRNFYKGI